MYPMKFDELHIQIGGIYCGIFEGTAYVSATGEVRSIELKGWTDHWHDRGKPASVDFIVPPASSISSPDAFFISVIAAELQNQYAADIREVLAEARAELPWRPDDYGPSQHQRL